MNDLFTETGHRFNQLGIKESFQVRDHQKLYYTIDTFARAGGTNLSLYSHLVLNICNGNFYNFFPPLTTYTINGDLI